MTSAPPPGRLEELNRMGWKRRKLCKKLVAQAEKASTADEVNEVFYQLGGSQCPEAVEALLRNPNCPDHQRAILALGQ